MTAPNRCRPGIEADSEQMPRNFAGSETVSGLLPPRSGSLLQAFMPPAENWNCRPAEAIKACDGNDAPRQHSDGQSSAFAPIVRRMSLRAGRIGTLQIFARQRGSVAAFTRASYIRERGRHDGERNYVG